MPPNFHSFSQRLIAWQKVHGRHDLPWQKNRDPYRIWLSEIMLQQTQVASVLSYYERFLSRFPTLADLAQASEEAVLAAWSGLGYYARGRHLHQAARQILTRHDGHFPSSLSDLMKLPGVGRSTAAAIAVFSFGARAAILDGNVQRILCRHAAIDGYPGNSRVRQQLWLLAESLLPLDSVASYTQGLMDLGSLVCRRQKPLCALCPLASDCQAHAAGRENEFPVRKPRPKIPVRECTWVLICHHQSVLLQRRPSTGIWGGLLTPPEELPDSLLAAGVACPAPLNLPPVQHRFTHFQLNIQPVLYLMPSAAQLKLDDHWRWQALTDLAEAALPTPLRTILAALPQALDAASPGAP